MGRSLRNVLRNSQSNVRLNSDPDHASHSDSATCGHTPVKHKGAVLITAGTFMTTLFIKQKVKELAILKDDGGYQRWWRSNLPRGGYSSTSGDQCGTSSGD